MKIITKKEVKEFEVIRYVAEDGKEFETKKQCKKYESEKKIITAIKIAEKLRINSLDRVIPLDADGDTEPEYSYIWYELKNEKDFNLLYNAYGDSIKKPKKYPEIVCVESIGFGSNKYSYCLSDIKEATETFWKRFGYQIDFNKN